MKHLPEIRDMHDMTMTWRSIFAAGRTNFTFSVLRYNLLLRTRQIISVAHLRI